MVAIIGLIFAFTLPAYHLVYQKDGLTFVAIEDMTKDECLARVKTFKPKAHAKCLLEEGEREIS